MDKNTRNGMLFILASSIGYAFFPIFVKSIYAHSDFTALDVGFWRFALAMPLMWIATTIWMRVTKAPKLTRPLPRFKLMAIGIFMAIGAMSAFFGLSMINAGVFVVLFYTYPIMTGIITALLGEPMPLRGWIALALTMIGVIFIAPEVLALRPQDINLGVVLALVNALAIALFVIANARAQRGYPTTARASAWSITGTLIWVLPLLIVPGIPIPQSATLWALLIGMSFFATVVPYFGLLIGVNLLGPNRAAIVGTTEPVIAILLAWMILGETMRPIQLVGALFIVASVVVLEARRMPRRIKKPDVAVEQS